MSSADLLTNRLIRLADARIALVKDARKELEDATHVCALAEEELHSTYRLLWLQRERVCDSLELLERDLESLAAQAEREGNMTLATEARASIADKVTR